MGRQPGRKGVSALMALKPETATRLRNGEREEVAINSLRLAMLLKLPRVGVYLPTANWSPGLPVLMKAP